MTPVEQARKRLNAAVVARQIAQIEHQKAAQALRLAEEDEWWAAAQAAQPLQQGEIEGWWAGNALGTYWHQRPDNVQGRVVARLVERLPKGVLQIEMMRQERPIVAPTPFLPRRIPAREADTWLRLFERGR
jgi:hypothetical protein